MTKEELKNLINRTRLILHSVQQTGIIHGVRSLPPMDEAQDNLKKIEAEFEQYIDVLEPIMEHSEYPYIRKDIRKMATLLQKNLLSLPIDSHPYCCLIISRVINAACDLVDEHKDVCSKCGKEIEK